MFDTSTVMRAQNAIDQQGQGLEVSFTWNVSDSIDFQTNLSIQDIENKNTREAVAGVADSQFYAAVTWSPLKDFRLVTDVNWIDNRDRESEDLREGVKDYALVNLTVNKAVPTLNIYEPLG